MVPEVTVRGYAQKDYDQSGLEKECRGIVCFQVSHSSNFSFRERESQAKSRQNTLNPFAEPGRRCLVVISGPGPDLPQLRAPRASAGADQESQQPAEDGGPAALGVLCKDGAVASLENHGRSSQERRARRQGQVWEGSSRIAADHGWLVVRFIERLFPSGMGWGCEEFEVREVEDGRGRADFFAALRGPEARVHCL